MKIVIIEDELKAASSLENMIAQLRPQAKVAAKLQSIEAAVQYFEAQGLPDLVFMDVQLSDGLCFEIFKSVKINCPVVFCTAYGEYALDAIKANGVDYLLKPFSSQDLETAFERVEGLRNFFQQHSEPILEEVLKKLGKEEGKKSFLVFRQNKYVTVPTDQIAFIYIKFTAPAIVTFAGEEYTINQSLDQVQQQLPASQFYRVNRQYLINFAAIKEVEQYFTRKLFVQLTIPTPDHLLIGKEKTTAFLNWLEDR